jgi:hypothetical protein
MKPQKIFCTKYIELINWDLPCDITKGLAVAQLKIKHDVRRMMRSRFRYNSRNS